MKNPELSLVIPLYNEEKNINNLLNTLTKSLNKKKINYEIIAVNNGSKDNTEKEIDKFSKKNLRVKKAVVKINEGYGNGILQGLKKTKGEYIGFLWGDNQISPDTTINVFETLKKEKIDLCKVTRITRTESLFRRLESFFYNSLMRILFGVKTSDTNGCPKIMKKSVYKNLNLESKDWFLDAEVLIKIKRNNYKMKEIPVKSKDRKSGKSSVNILTAFEFIKNIFKYRFFY